LPRGKGMLSGFELLFVTIFIAAGLPRPHGWHQAPSGALEASYFLPFAPGGCGWPKLGCFGFAALPALALSFCF